MTKTQLNIDPLYSDFAYDDAFRTMETECDDLLIPYVNFCFGEKFDNGAIITRLRNEQFLEHDDHSGEKRITDSNFEIRQGNIAKRYHLECESKPYDKSILVRIFEYDAQGALDTAQSEKSTLRVKFPNTGLLMLRGSSRTPDVGVIIIETPEGEVSYHVPIIKMMDLDIDKIFEKHLFLLIPFYIFNYEKDLKKINSDENRIEKLKELYRNIIERLEACQRKGILCAQSYRVIINVTQTVFYKLTLKHDEIHQKVGDIMGGKVLPLPVIVAYHDGESKGKIEGKIEAVKNLMTNLNMTLEQALAAIGISSEQYEEYMSKIK